MMPVNFMTTPQTV